MVEENYDKFIRNVEREAKNLIAPLTVFQQYTLFGVTLGEMQKRNPEDRQYELMCVLNALLANRELSRRRLQQIANRYKGSEKWLKNNL
jgi:hypothetical protein